MFTRLLLITFLSLALSNPLQATETPFGRGINLSEWFQADSAAEIQFNKYSKQDFERIKNLGVDVIRLPINLHFMTDGAPDYTLDPLFLDYLDQVVDWTEEMEIHLILDNHTFDPSADTEPDVEVPLLAVWPQMAEHYLDRSDLISYEVLNEPHGIDDATWNAIQQRVVEAIRSVDDVHTIIIGGAGWNSFNNLEAMPVYDDDNLIYTFHFYEPFLFTHQGAGWVTPSMEELGNVPFPYSSQSMPALPASLAGSWVAGAYDNYSEDGNVARVKELLDIVIAFREERQVPLFLGELGVMMNNADNEDRAFWYRTVREYLEENNIAWTSWDYHGSFGLFKRGSDGEYDHDLNTTLLEALGFNVPPQTTSVSEPDRVGFSLYNDSMGAGIQSAGYTDGQVSMASGDRPYDGRRSISWAGAAQFDVIGFNFAPDRDISFLRTSDYALDLFIRGNTPGVEIDVRFVDTRTDDASDRAWRMQTTIDESLITWDDQWHRVNIPLANFSDVGAWENGEWFDSQNAFDWSAVDSFEITAQNQDLAGITLHFDNLQLTSLPPGPARLLNNHAINGVFYDPQTSGQGLDFNIHVDGLTVFFYGHTANGQRLWLISENSQEALEFDQPLTLELYEIPTGEFGNPTARENFWGTGTFTFYDCLTGNAQLQGTDGTTELNLVRLTSPMQASCTMDES